MDGNPLLKLSATSQSQKPTSCSSISGRRALHVYSDISSSNSELQKITLDSPDLAQLKCRKITLKRYRHRRFASLSPCKEKTLQMSTNKDLKEEVIIIQEDNDIATGGRSTSNTAASCSTDSVSVHSIASSSSDCLSIYPDDKMVVKENGHTSVITAKNSQAAQESSAESKFVQMFKFLRDRLQQHSFLGKKSLTDEPNAEDDDLIVVSKIDDNVEVTYWDIKRVVKNIVSNIMLSNTEDINTLTATQIAQRMKNLYHRDFSHRIEEISRCLELAKLKCQRSFPQLQEIRPGLRSQDLDTLEPGEWLNDVIVNKYLDLLVKSRAMSCHLSSFFYEELCRNVKPSLPEDWHKKQWLLIPICIEHHWSLLCAAIDKRALHIFNSLPMTERELECAGNVLIYIQCLYNLKANVETKWTLRMLDDLPTQANAYDCGVYVCMFARKILFNLSSRFGPHQVTEFREWMRNELLQNKLIS